MQVKRAQLTWTYVQTKKKLEEVKAIIKVTREAIEINIIIPLSLCLTLPSKLLNPIAANRIKLKFKTILELQNFILNLQRGLPSLG